MFKFLEKMTAKQSRERESGQQKYAALVKRAALLDDLADKEVDTLAELHAEHGKGRDLADVAVAIRRHRDAGALRADAEKALRATVNASAAMEAFGKETHTLIEAQERALHELKATRDRESTDLFNAYKAASRAADSAEQARLDEAQLAIDYADVLGDAPDPIAKMKEIDAARAALKARLDPAGRHLPTFDRAMLSGPGVVKEVVTERSQSGTECRVVYRTVDGDYIGARTATYADHETDAEPGVVAAASAPASGNVVETTTASGITETITRLG